VFILYYLDLPIPIFLSGFFFSPGKVDATEKMNEFAQLHAVSNDDDITKMLKKVAEIFNRIDPKYQSLIIGGAIILAVLEML
jgi:hypothetical protein